VEGLVQQPICFVDDLESIDDHAMPSSLTRNRKCCRVKFCVFDRWSIRRPGVAMRMSTLLDPPSSLLVSCVPSQHLQSHNSSRSAISWFCSCAKLCCPVAVPILRQRLACCRDAGTLTTSPVPLARLSSVSRTCTTRSRVGSTISALSLTILRSSSVLITGMLYARVFPEPVGAEMR